MLFYLGLSLYNALLGHVLALVVEDFKLRSQLFGLPLILRQKQTQSQLGRLKPSPRVQAWADDKADVVGGNLSRVQLIGTNQRPQPQILCVGNPLKPLLHHDPVLILELHHISHRSHSRQLHHFQPLLPGYPRPLIKNLDQLVGHHGPADLGKWVGAVPPLRVYQGVCGRQQILLRAILQGPGLNIMMVCHHHRHPKLLCQSDLGNGGNTIVAGENRIDSLRRGNADNGFIDPVSVLDPIRNLPVRLRPQPL